jgi:hypothetical protein
MFGDAPAFLIFNRGAGRKTRTKHTLSYACFTTIIFTSHQPVRPHGQEIFWVKIQITLHILIILVVWRHFLCSNMFKSNTKMMISDETDVKFLFGNAYNQISSLPRGSLCHWNKKVQKRTFYFW